MAVQVTTAVTCLSCLEILQLVRMKFGNVDMVGRSEYTACFSGVPEGIQL